MALVAVQSAQIIDAAHQGTVQIISGTSNFTKINGQAVLLDGLKVIVAGGTVPGNQVDPVTIEFKANTIINTKIEGKKPLAIGEVTDGTDMANYQVGNVVSPLPIVLSIVDAGQTTVDAT